MISFDMEKLFVNSRASICINNNIYIDPYRFRNAPHNAKAVFITHPHRDHLSIKDIKKVSNEETQFYAPQDCFKILRRHGFQNLNEKLPDYAVSFPSYCKPFHRRSKNWVGYILTIDDTRYATCGDTDSTPELAAIKCDVLFVPIGGIVTMNARQAAQCANIIKPKIVIPIHYRRKSCKRIFLKYLDKNIKYEFFL